MAKFHGPVNLHLGASADKDGNPVPAWAQSEWDPESGSYVIDVTGDDLKKFRAVADDYGFSDAKAAKSGDGGAEDDKDA